MNIDIYSEDMAQVTALRLKLLANGYTPIRNRDKIPAVKAWQKVKITGAEIKRWQRMSSARSTGLRIENGLAVIDFDIDDQEAMDSIYHAVLDALPELDRADVPLLVRGGKGAKEAWFVRTDEPFGRIFSSVWVRPGETADDGMHRVEIFAGGSPRQFGAFNWHTVGVLKYRWRDQSPADIRLDQLPVLAKKQFFLICDIVSRKLEELGWHHMDRLPSGENLATRVYDLTEDMAFDCDDGFTRTLDELRAIAALGDVRCSASWLEGPRAVNRTRCLVGMSRFGGVSIYETASCVTHFEVTEKLIEIDMEEVRKALATCSAQGRFKG